MLFQAALKTIARNRLISNFPSHYRWVSSSTSISVNEVEIPVPFVKNHIAAKIWESHSSNSHTEKSTPIICVHGWGDSVSAFEPLIQLLMHSRAGQTALAFDFPGHGMSYHTPGPYSNMHMEGLLSILRIIRHFSWDKVSLVGHSFGGLVALSFAANFPELVKALIGIEMFHPLFMNVDGPNQFALTNNCLQGILDTEKKLMNSVNRHPPSYTRQQMIQKMVTGREPQGGLTPEGCDMLIDRGAKKLPNGKLQFTHDPRNVQFFWLARLAFLNVLAMAECVTCPMSVITCHETWNPDNVPIVKDLVSKLAVTAKPFEHNKVSGTHHVHMLQPEVVAPIINRFLINL